MIIFNYNKITIKQYIMTLAILIQAQSLLGKTIYAEGWHYDNSGFISGTITLITQDKFSKGFRVYVESNAKLGMNDFVFTIKEMEILLAEGVLPRANRFLNTGTNAELK